MRNKTKLFLLVLLVLCQTIASAAGLSNASNESVDSAKVVIKGKAAYGGGWFLPPVQNLRTAKFVREKCVKYY